MMVFLQEDIGVDRQSYRLSLLRDFTNEKRESTKMNKIVNIVNKALQANHLSFSKKPLFIGGRAMEYYDIRKSGNDIDFVITDEDYQRLAKQYPDRRKDLYGDLGVTIGEFEIWRSIAHLDYDFYSKEAIDEGEILIISIDRLLWSRVCAMDVEKYKEDLILMREYYYKQYTNQEFHSQAALHEESYRKMNGAVFGGNYND